MVKDNPRIAVIGAGDFGKHHARILNELGCLAAICDIDSTKAKVLATKYNVQSCSTIEDMLANERLDGCVICTPTRSHAVVAKKTLQHGINTFVEKPMSISFDECKGMMEISKNEGVVLTSGYIERFNPAVTETRKLIESGKYGEPMMIEFHRENRMPSEARDVGIIHELSVHDIYTSLYLFGKEPTVVFARAGKRKHRYEDFATIMLGFEGQKVAVIASNWPTPKKVRTFSAVCTDGIISGDFVTQAIRIDQADSTTVPRQQFQEPLTLELKNFIEAIEGKSKIVVTAADATKVTRVAEAAIQSVITNVPVLL